MRGFRVIVPTGPQECVIVEQENITRSAKQKPNRRKS